MQGTLTITDRYPDSTASKGATAIERLPNRILGAYSLPAIPLAMLITPIIIYLPAFYAGHLGIGLTAVGVVFFLGRLWDGVTDPFVGWLSDRHRFRYGRRKPWILVGTPFLIVATYILCRPPEHVGVTYLLGALIFFYVAYTAVRIPYISWGAELSPNYLERNRITGLRELGTMLGIFTSVAVPYLFLGGENVTIDSIMTVFTVCVIVMLPVAAILSARLVPDSIADIWPRKPLRRELGVLWRNKPFMRILAAQATLFLGTYMYNACLVFLVEHTMGLPGQFLPLILIEYTVMIAFVPVLLWVGKRLDKHRVISFGVIVQIIAFVAMAAVTPGSFWQAAVAFAIVGISFASWFIIPTSMIADTVDFGKMRGGGDSAGMYMALFNFIDKAALALAALIALPLLDLMRFDPQGENSGLALYSVKVAGLFLPMGMIFVAVLFYWNYPISRRKHATVIRYELRKEKRRI